MTISRIQIVKKELGIAYMRRFFLEMRTIYTYYTKHKSNLTQSINENIDKQLEAFCY